MLTRPEEEMHQLQICKTQWMKKLVCSLYLFKPYFRMSRMLKSKQISVIVSGLYVNLIIGFPNYGH